MLVGEPAQLVVGAVLHRMRDEHQSGVGAERFGLRLGPLNELGRRDADRRNATLLEVRHVMRTARYARPSVAEAFDHQIDFAGDLLLQRQRGRAGVGRLLVALDRDAAFPEPLVETVEEHIAARLGDVEQADRQPVEPLRARQARPDRRTSLRCRVEEYGHGRLLFFCRCDKGPSPGAVGSSASPRYGDNFQPSLWRLIFHIVRLGSTPNTRVAWAWL